MLTITIKSDLTLETPKTLEILVDAIGRENIYRVELNTKPGTQANPDGAMLVASVCGGLREHLAAFQIRVCGLASGYKGAGPYDLIACLRTLGITVPMLDDETIINEANLHLAWEAGRGADRELREVTVV